MLIAETAVACSSNGNVNTSVNLCSQPFYGTNGAIYNISSLVGGMYRFIMLLC